MNHPFSIPRPVFQSLFVMMERAVANKINAMDTRMCLGIFLNFTNAVFLCAYKVKMPVVKAKISNRLVGKIQKVTLIIYKGKQKIVNRIKFLGLNRLI